MSSYQTQPQKHDYSCEKAAHPTTPLSQWREANRSGEGGATGELAGKEAAPCSNVPGFEIEMVNGIGLAAFGAV
jgi:hypothetical protein